MDAQNLEALQAMTVVELREIAKGYSIPNTHVMRKAELIEAIARARGKDKAGVSVYQCIGFSLMD